MTNTFTKKYLTALGIPHALAKDYASRTTITCSTKSGIQPINSDIEKKLKELSEMHNGKYQIYHIILSHMLGCDIVDFLMRPLNPEEENSLFDGVKHGYALSYCWNTDIPEFSEPGLIAVKYNPSSKSLIRLA